jgi:hypothetical protein
MGKMLWISCLKLGQAPVSSIYATVISVESIVVSGIFLLIKNYCDLFQKYLKNFFFKLYRYQNSYKQKPQPTQNILHHHLLIRYSFSFRDCRDIVIVRRVYIRLHEQRQHQTFKLLRPFPRNSNDHNPILRLFDIQLLQSHFSFFVQLLFLLFSFIFFNQLFLFFCYYLFFSFL